MHKRTYPCNGAHTHPMLRPRRLTALNRRLPGGCRCAPETGLGPLLDWPPIVVDRAGAIDPPSPRASCGGAACRTRRGACHGRSSEDPTHTPRQLRGAGGPHTDTNTKAQQHALKAAEAEAREGKASPPRGTRGRGAYTDRGGSGKIGTARTTGPRTQNQHQSQSQSQSQSQMNDTISIFRCARVS